MNPPKRNMTPMRAQSPGLAVPVLLFSLVLAAVVPLAAATTNGPEPLSLEIDLTDGSKVVCQPQEESFPFRTSYMETKLEYALVDQWQAATDGESFRVTLANGDRMAGTILLEHLQVRTILGEVRVPLCHISRLRRRSRELPVADGLILWLDARDFSPDRWPDRSGHGADGVPQHVSRAEDGCPQFNGRNSLITIPRTEELNRFTLAVWARKPDPASRLAESIFSCGARGDFYIDYGGAPQANAEWRTVVVPRDGTGVRQRNFVGHRFGEAWAFFCVVYDDTSLKTYADAQLRASAPSGAAPGKTTDHYWLGRRGPDSPFFQGVLGDVYLYDRALEEEEIRRLFLQGRSRFSNRGDLPGAP
ncbi:LamG domain-containing protein [bacterium]|nr:LamG domain-containing protein [bacterium]